jgi:hypothetical protein
MTAPLSLSLALATLAACALPAAAATVQATNAPAAPAPAAVVRNPFPDPYNGEPTFIGAARGLNGGEYGRDQADLAKAMELSFEPSFYTLTDLCGYSKPEPRSAALVQKALEKELKGEYREAIEIY